MPEKLVPTTVMLYPEEIKELEKIAKKERRSKSSVLRIAFLDYVEICKNN